jgi:glycosyltransferase involved in cell wall biosynthesis
MGENGIYAADDRIENLAEKMIWAVEHPREAKELGDRNRQRVEKVFSWNNSIKDTVKAFEMLVSRGES